MKESELREHVTCSACKKKIGHTSIPMFWIVKADRYGIDMNAVKRSAGLGMMLGSPQLAQVMGPNEDLAESIYSAEVTLCEDCALPFISLLEKCGAFE